MDERSQPVRRWVFIRGVWKQDEGSITFVGETTPGAATNGQVSPSGDPIPAGYARTDVYFDGGKVNATVTLPSSHATLGHVLLGWHALPTRFIAAGFGSMTGHAYAIMEFDVDTPGYWRTLDATGSIANLRPDFPEPIAISVEGQSVALEVDGVMVLQHVLDRPLERSQIGVMAQGAVPITFSSLKVAARARSAFVVMQFTSPFDELFEEVIKPVCTEVGVGAYRVSDIYRPGVVLQDITRGLAESDVIIAEVTPTNANVFYELGYAHALRKPVVLLAERDTPLPFDVSGYRVIFYENAIRGKNSLEADLRRHLVNIFGAIQPL